jgi:hypothetical protein
MHYWYKNMTVVSSSSNPLLPFLVPGDCLSQRHNLHILLCGTSLTALACFIETQHARGQAFLNNQLVLICISVFRVSVTPLNCLHSNQVSLGKRHSTAAANAVHDELTLTVSTVHQKRKKHSFCYSF